MAAEEESRFENTVGKAQFSTVLHATGKRKYKEKSRYYLTNSWQVNTVKNENNKVFYR